MKPLRGIWLPILFLMVFLPGKIQSQTHEHQADAPKENNESWRQLLDKKAPEIALDRWVNSEALNLEKLKGKVVLLRWWLETCPYCRATAPSLNEFYDEYSDKGLVIIGMYHPKPLGKKVSAKMVKEFADAKQFEFPIAIDQEWDMLNSYWPKHINMSYTSVSFLIDRKGIIRYIHPGGSYSILGQPFNDPQWEKDYHAIKAKIEALLSR